MVSFFVPGIPRPAGSKTAFFNKKTGKPMITDSSGKKGSLWRADVKCIAMDRWRDDLLTCPVELNIKFAMPRPKNHYRSNGELKPTAPRIHIKRPDSTKLLRAVEDALTGIVWKDDAQVSFLMVSKFYDEKPGAYITVSAVDARANTGGKDE